MTYTILSAGYANEEHTAALVVTEEAAAVLVSQADTPELWVELHASGLAIAAYEIPQTVEQNPIEKLKAFLSANPDVEAAL